MKLDELVNVLPNKQNYKVYDKHGDLLVEKTIDGMHFIDNVSGNAEVYKIKSSFAIEEDCAKSILLIYVK